MTNHVLSRIPIPNRFVDERFTHHRPSSVQPLVRLSFVSWPSHARSRVSSYLGIGGHACFLAI